MVNRAKFPLPPEEEISRIPYKIHAVVGQPSHLERTGGVGLEIGTRGHSRSRAASSTKSSTMMSGWYVESSVGSWYRLT